MWSLSSAFALSLLSTAYGSIGPSANLYIENDVISPDGFSRSAVLAGAVSGAATFPGPLIVGQKGDTFNLNLVNNLDDTSMLVSTSIHWHGFFQKGSAWADGPVGVNQCPIIPGNSFNYQFTALDQAGTYWYHSHYSTQYCDGLRGAMVVYDPADPYLSQYDVDDDTTVITLADWYHTVAPVLAASGIPPQSDATLINGLGRYAGDLTAPLAVITVTPNKRYRFRLVSVSCDPNYVFSIDNHTMIIIEVDGQNVQPLSVDSIQIYAGQRYSFILQANQQTSNYWVRALPNVGGPSGFTGGVNSAILRYAGAAIVDPVTPQTTSVRAMNETQLQPLTNPAAPGPAVSAANSNGTVFPLSFNIALTGGAFTVNQVSFVPPSVPVLLQILSGNTAAQSLLPTGSVYTLPLNSVIEINIPGGAPGAPHPIHLHGHAFSVVRSAGSTVYNYNNPVRRDVVNSGTSTSDNVTIRFETDNAGPWIMHCHIDWHLDRGLAVVMAEDPTDIVSAAHPAAWDALCPAFNALPAQTFT
ncbi:multicopper oxidase [Hypholoma sublateritium FD-334 SS-4]|uniref:Multicopper oxidase n=1 Tax=Hypholoma sublateritium (strain FD-334 SS-4) TaxID=945553 RepID=A0A0D2PQ31_HYPSF|nr:multicopper oxidase [Hypholoma sublateritium FD-334 SS-4]